MEEDVATASLQEEGFRRIVEDGDRVWGELSDCFEGTNAWRNTSARIAGIAHSDQTTDRPAVHAEKIGVSIRARACHLGDRWACFWVASMGSLFGGLPCGLNPSKVDARTG